MIKKEQIQNSVKAFLHGFSQVIFIENSISAIFILLAITLFSYESKNYNLILASILSNIFANLCAFIIISDTRKVVSGLYAFNAVLLGIAFASFFSNAKDIYILSIIASLISVPLTKVLNSLTAKLKLSGLTFPFIVLSWFFILFAYKTGMADLKNQVDLSSSDILKTRVIWTLVFIKPFGEIYLLDSVIASILIFLAFVVAKWKSSLMIVIALLFSSFLAFIFTADIYGLNLGLYAYNALLVLMALETFSTKKNNAKIYTLIVFFALVLCSFLDYAIFAITKSLKLPALTLSFVITSWIILYVEQKLRV